MTKEEVNFYYYKVMPMSGIFLGLSPRAVEYLLLFGEWSQIKDISSEIISTSDFGLLFIGKEDNEDELLLAGSIWGDRILTTTIHEYAKIKHGKEYAKIPLYKYKLANFENNIEEVWLHEIMDKKQSVYKNLHLLCLTFDHKDIVCEWLDKEIELSEVLYEYTQGNF